MAVGDNHVFGDYPTGSPPTLSGMIDKFDATDRRDAFFQNVFALQQAIGQLIGEGNLELIVLDQQGRPHIIEDHRFGVGAVFDHPGNFIRFGGNHLFDHFGGNVPLPGLGQQAPFFDNIAQFLENFAVLEDLLQFVGG